MIVTEQIKTCKACGETKALDLFPVRYRKDRDNDRHPRCRKCHKSPRNPETLKAQKARHYAKYRERYKTKQREYRSTEAGRTFTRQWHLKQRHGLEVGHSESDWRRLLARHGGRCFYCQEPATERDHVIPLSRGGTDFIGNILPSCRDCNNRKNNKLLVEWRKRAHVPEHR